MIRLDTTTRTLEIILTAAKTTNDMSCMVSYSDDVPGISYTGASKLTYSNGITAATICSAPASGAVRDIDFVSVYNADTAPKTVTIRINDNGTFYPLVDVVMQVDDRLDYTHGSGWQILSSAGGTVTSVFGRAGAVTALSSDYSAFYAALAGSASQTFSVATATAAAHAVRSDQLSADNVKFPFYQEGTWTATLTASISAPTTPITSTGSYVRKGNSVTLNAQFANVNTTGANGILQITGVPFTAARVGIGAAIKVGIGTSNDVSYIESGTAVVNLIESSTFTATNIVAGAGKYVYIDLEMVKV